MAAAAVALVKHELDYHRQIVSQLLQEDALVVMAHGLGVRVAERLLLQEYITAGRFVFVINASTEDQSAIIEELGMEDVQPLPLVIDTAVTIAGRTGLYRQGGIIFITARILVVDLLCGRVPLDQLDGIVVCNAHRVTETSTESFILRLYRQGNKRGFIKAFTEHVEEYASGFSKLEKSLKYLCLRKVQLWPRFHVDVTKSLEGGNGPADVVELCQRMTPAMERIQAAILEVIDACIQELGRSNAAIDLTELTVESALFKSFDAQLRLQLDPIWHRVSARTKQLVNDLKSLRKLLTYLTSYDAVSLHSFLETLLTGYHSLGYQSPWLLMDAANTVFSSAKARVFEVKQRDVPTALNPRTLTAEDVVPVLEENPKWALLHAVLDEVKEQREQMASEHGAEDGAPDVVLVTVADDRTATQLREILVHGPEHFMKRMLRDHFRWRQSLPRLAANVKAARQSGAASAPPSASSHSHRPHGQGQAGAASSGGRKRKSAAAAKYDMKRAREAGAAAMAETTALSEFLAWFPEDDQRERATFMARVRRQQGASSADAAGGDDGDAGEDGEADEVDETFDMGQFNEHFGLLAGSHVVVHTLADAEAALWALRPRVVIMYDPELEFVRQVEVYRAAHADLPLRVYFLLYDKSVEEQRYLSAVRKEQTAFERLIRDKSLMSIAVSENTFETYDDDRLTVSTRQGGGRVVLAARSAKVVVDVREFRSALPFFLYQRGMRLAPVTLEVGDYVLSPDICVERKSVNDLIQSLGSGRLYAQVEAMALHYKYPVLLIEFDQAKSFVLQLESELREDVSIANVSSKLVLLLIHFPVLRILWSSSPHQTAEMFAELKKNVPEPDEDVAVAVGQEDGAAAGDFDLAAQELLLRLPGVNTKNYRHIMRHVDSVAALAAMSLAALQDLMGAQPAKELHAFLHKDASG